MQLVCNLELTDLNPLTYYEPSHDYSFHRDQLFFEPSSETPLPSSPGAARDSNTPYQLSEQRPAALCALYYGQDAPDRELSIPSFRAQRDYNNRFRWGQQQRQVFAVVVTALGINRVRPKTILKFMPADYRLDTAMIGSHLYKYRKRVQQQYKFSSLGSVKNWMVPNDSYSALVKLIYQRWHETDFDGFTDFEIIDFLRQIK